MNNQSVRSFTWVPFEGLVASLACVPVLCHLGSTMNTAYVVRRVRDRRGQLDNYHDVTHDLLLFFIVISSCRFSLSSWNQTTRHSNTRHHEKHHIQVSKWQSSTDLGDEAFKVVTLPETNNPSGPKRKLHLSTIIYLQGRAVSVREGKKNPKMNVNQPAALFLPVERKNYFDDHPICGDQLMRIICDESEFPTLQRWKKPLNLN